MADHPFRIIDSHIHLYAKAHLDQLNWTAALPADHVLNRQNSVEQYKAATGQPSNLLGFVFVETDRKSGLDELAWTDSLDEVAFLAHIAQGSPQDDGYDDHEGHSAEDSRLVLGVVPWAPVPAGPAILEKYVAQVNLAFGDGGSRGKIKGFRYLLQDKPAGTMLQPDFASGLRWLGERGFTFDLGIDLRQGGAWQLEEACTMMDRLFASTSTSNNRPLKIVINHCCKPDLHISLQNLASNETFLLWSRCIRHFARFPSTYMKLSGLFSELPPEFPHQSTAPTTITTIVRQIAPWWEVVLDAFCPRRIMFGSDWPVCCAGIQGLGLGLEPESAWRRWVDVVTALLLNTPEKRLSQADRRRIWSETAAEAYGISLPS